MTVRFPLREAAIEYAAMGLALLPIVPHRKIPPLYGEWQHNLICDREGAERQWSRERYANIGMATGTVSGGLVVLDIDPRNGGDAALAKLEAEHEPLPETVAAATPSGGQHLYFRSDDPDLRNSAGRVGQGLDVRANGGFVVLPPSAIRRDDGSVAHYRWARGHSILEFSPAPLPRWLAAKMRRRVRPVPPDSVLHADEAHWSRWMHGTLNVVLYAGEGERNSKLYWAACRFGEKVREGKVTRAFAEIVLARAALKIGLCDGETMATIRSGLDAG